MTPSDRKILVRLASALPQLSDERRALQGLLSREAALKPADLEALKKVEAEEGMDPKAIGLSVSKIVALEKLGLVHYDRGDGSVLLTNEGEKHLKGKTASVKAVEPYQKVEGHPYGSGKVDVIKGVRTERELRALSKLLDEAYGKPLTHDLINKMKKYGIGPVGMEAVTSGGGGYMLYLTDATGEEYDVFNDLGI